MYWTMTNGVVEVVTRKRYANYGTHRSDHVSITADVDNCCRNQASKFSKENVE